MAQTSSPSRRTSSPRRTPRSAPDFRPVVIAHHPVTDVAGGGESKAGSRLFMARMAPLGLVLIGLIAGIAGLLPVLIPLVVVGFAIMFVNWRLGNPAHLRQSLGARTIVARDEPRLFNLLEGLCVANGLPNPAVELLDDPCLNAIVLGHGPDDAVLIVTRGLLDALDRMELEGVLAHELAHIRRGDLALASQATTALGLVAYFNQCGRAVRNLSGSGREAIADAIAVRMTRYPPGLISAMKKLERTESVRPRSLSQATARLTAALWCIPLEESYPREPIPGVLDPELRMAALREL